MAVSDETVLASAAQATSYTMATQLTFRLCTFVLNGVMLRYISRDILGVVNVRLALLATTSLFLSNEPFMRASLSRAKRERCWPEVINLVWCAVPYGALIVALTSTIWVWVLEQPDEESIPYYTLAVCIYALSALIEILVQPLHILGQLLLFLRAKTIIEGIAQSVRCILMVILVIFRPDWGLLSFCIAQLSYSCVMTSLYYAYFIRRCKSGAVDSPFKNISNLIPRVRDNKPFVSVELGYLTWSFIKQSGLKQVLTEGERYVMTLFNVLSFSQQGIYDMIHNLGSLAARFLFLPIEEGFYLFISQTMHRGELAVNQPHDSMKLVARLFEALLRMVTYIGLTFLVFGYSYSFLLLDIYGGHILSGGSGPVSEGTSGTTLLRWYCVYVLLMAINGVTEGFKNATMKTSQVDAYNKMMLYFAIGFLVSAGLLTHFFGSVGFILANCCNMVARIVHSYRFIRTFFEGYISDPLKGLFIPLYVFFSYCLAGSVMCMSEKMLCCTFGWLYNLIHVAVGGFSLLSILVVIWFSEREMIWFFREQYSKRRQVIKLD